MNATRPRLPWGKIIGTLLLGVVIEAVAVLCTLSIVLSPIGLVLLFLGGVPLYRVLQTHWAMREAYNNSTEAAEGWNEGTPKPWFLDDVLENPIIFEEY